MRPTPSRIPGRARVVPRPARRRGALAVVATLAALALLPALPGRSEAGAPRRTVPGSYLVKTRPGIAASDRARVWQSADARGVRRFDFAGIDHVRAVRGDPDSVLARLRRDPRVLYAEPDVEWGLDVVPNDPDFFRLYGLRNTGQTGGAPGADVKATVAWDRFTGDPGVLVAVLDTGIDLHHPDLAANLWTNPGEIPGNGLDDDGNGYVDDVHGYDVLHGDGDPSDDHGHGTHVAGTIAAVGNNGIGIAGVAWRARLAAVKFLSAAGTGTTAGAIAALAYAVAIGARVTNNSWGGGTYSQALRDAIDAAGSAGQLFVAAAGNEATDTDVAPHYPASYDSPYVIAVAASDAADALAPFSNVGAVTVDLAAPGVGIFSTLPGGRYGSLSGTSMAAPHVAGGTALLAGLYPDLSPLQWKDLLLGSAEPKAAWAGRLATGGRLDLGRAVAARDTIPPGRVSDLRVLDVGSSALALAWTAVGDDGTLGRAARYELRYATAPFDEGAVAGASPAAAPAPGDPGAAESVEIEGLAFSTTYFVRIRAVDEQGNAGPLSNTVTVTTLGAPRLALDAASVSMALASGTSDARALVLRNEGAGRLDWRLAEPEPVLTASAAAPNAPAPKGGEDTRDGVAAAGTQGGPDAYGYRWISGDDPGGPVFAWIGAEGETATLPVTGDDAVSPPVPLGFSFPFYGKEYASARIATDGWLAFEPAAPTCDNQPLPGALAPAALVAPFWDDFDFGAAPRVETSMGEGRFVVTWIAVPRYGGGGACTFQAALHPDGSILFQYLAVAPPADKATVGIQDASRTMGTTVAFNAVWARDGLAVRFLPPPRWLRAEPASGRTAAGSEASPLLTADASGLDAGTYRATLGLATNDPDAPWTAIDVTLAVSGAPAIAVAEDSLDLGTVETGSSAVRSLRIENRGSDLLTVASVGDAELRADPASFALPAHGARQVTVTWAPLAPGPAPAALRVVSDDPKRPEVLVPVVGRAVAPPRITARPAAWSGTVAPGESVSVAVALENTGERDLAVGIAALQPAAAPAIVHAPGSPGYAVDDSRAPGGPAFAWSDVRGIGTTVAMVGDDKNAGPFPIGFPFPFFGAVFDSFRVCTNGWISFTSAKTSHGNTPLPSAAGTTPENLVAAFWDDLDFGSTPRVTRFTDGTRLVVQYQDVRRFGETAGNTFEIVLHRDGTILVAFAQMGAANLSSATVGIQDATRSIGVAAVSNGPYVASGLAVRFRPAPRTLRTSPPWVLVPAGGAAAIDLEIRGQGLPVGVHPGALRFATSDPAILVSDLPVGVRVAGTAAWSAEPAAIDYGDAAIGTTALRQAVLHNAGTDTVVVASIASSDAAFAADAAALRVPPGGEAIVTVAFRPAAEAPAAGTLTFRPADGAVAPIEVALSGRGVPPPRLDVDAAALVEALPSGAASTRLLSVANTGGSDLALSVATALRAASVPVYEPLDPGKGGEDPRTGFVGGRGPDASGVSWSRSDDAGAPAFAWIPVPPGAGHLPLAGDDAVSPPVPIGFAFPLGGSAWDSVRVSTDGWLALGAATPAPVNQPLPIAGGSLPAPLVAALWDDYDFGAQPRAYAFGDGARFVVAWVAAPRRDGSGTATFQTVLERDGTIRVNLLAVGSPPPASATIGLEHAGRDDGLTVVHNAPFARDSLAVTFRTTPRWLAATPATAVVPPGEAREIRLDFAASGLAAGAVATVLRLEGNDPAAPRLEIPVTLEVLAPTSAEDASAATPAFRWRALSANPAASGVFDFRLELGAASPVRVQVFDARGRLVRTLASGRLPAGAHRIAWDGRGDGGIPAASGVYFARARAARGDLTVRIVVVR